MKFLRKLHQWQVEKPRANHHRGWNIPQTSCTKDYQGTSGSHSDKPNTMAMKVLVDALFQKLPKKKRGTKTQDPPRISSQFLWFQGIKNPTNSIKSHTPPETNIARETRWLEYYFPFRKAYFQGRTVSFGKGNFQQKFIENSGSCMSEMQPEAVLATAAASEGHKPQLTDGVFRGKFT